MRGFPINPAVNVAIAEYIQAEDAVSTAAVGERLTNLISTHIGFVYMVTNDGDDETLMIRLTKDYNFQAKHYAGVSKPNAALIKSSDTLTFIAVDETFVEWNKPTSPQWKQNICEAIIFHETGHYLCGHIKTTPQIRLNMVPQLTEAMNHPLSPVVDVLLRGAVYDIELQADTMALCGIDDPMKIITMHAYLASVSETFGCRLEHSNRVDRLIEILESEEWAARDFSKDGHIEIHYLDE